MKIRTLILLATCASLGACSSTGYYGWHRCRADIGRNAHQFFNPERNWDCGERQEQPAMAPARTMTTTQTTQTMTQQQPLLPVIHSYTLYFGFNRADIRPGEKQTLEQISSEIQKYNPAQVTVTGFTDTSGSKAYNMKLSAKRARMVSEALTRKGVPNQTLDEQARGEEDLAVPTADGVKNPQNRRVVVDFRK